MKSITEVHVLGTLKNYAQLCFKGLTESLDVDVEEKYFSEINETANLSEFPDDFGEWVASTYKIFNSD